LVWLFDKGTVTVQTTYLEKPYMAEVNVIQACIMKLFDKEDRITVKRIIDTLGIDLAQFRQVMKTNLCRPKVGML
jgi:hypothetical protein